MMTWQDKHKFDADEAAAIKRAEEEEIRMAALVAAVAAGGNLEDMEEGTLIYLKNWFFKNFNNFNIFFNNFN